MELKGTRTEKNLWKAFGSECQARSRYLFSAQQAHENGLQEVADIFTELAANEGEHARQEFDFLGGLGDVRIAIETAIQGEDLEQNQIYPAFAREAREEGFETVAAFFEKMAAVEATHAQRLRDLLSAVDGKGELAGRTVHHSAIHMAQVMMPDQANPSGYVHGGELIKIADNAAGVVAARHANEDIVLARVADIQFLAPVEVGNLVITNGFLTFVSRSSMEVCVEMEVESLITGERSRALSAYLIMVAIDEEGRPTPVPALLISTEAQQARYETGKARYDAYKSSHKK